MFIVSLPISQALRQMAPCLWPMSTCTLRLMGHAIQRATRLGLPALVLEIGDSIFYDGWPLLDAPLVPSERRRLGFVFLARNEPMSVPFANKPLCTGAPFSSISTSAPRSIPTIPSVAGCQWGNSGSTEGLLAYRRISRLRTRSVLGVPPSGKQVRSALKSLSRCCLGENTPAFFERVDYDPRPFFLHRSKISQIRRWCLPTY
jgi:hypothetical protein